MWPRRDPPANLGVARGAWGEGVAADYLRRAGYEIVDRNAWRRVNRWRGNFRFDVIEVYGTPEGGRPVIDHIADVALFVRRERFVKW